MFKKLFILTVLILTTKVFAQSENIEIKTKNLKKANYLKVNDFYLTHHLYIDMFLRENLYPEATIADVDATIKAIKTYVSEESSLDIEIDKPGKRNYLIRIAVIKKENTPDILVVFTNWDAKDKHFEKKISIENDSYTRWYYLVDDKMTYRKDISDKNDYSEMSKSDLANAYLFDEIKENDDQVEKLIEENLVDNDLSITEEIYSNLILLKLYILQGVDKNIKVMTEYLDEKFKEHELDKGINGLKMAYKATLFQKQLMDK